MAEKKDPIRSLIDTGRRAGKLTSSEISDAMEENGNVLDVEAMEKLYEELESNGIEIVDDTPVDVSSALPSSEEGADDYEDGLTADGITIDDPVKVYLKEIGRVPLLSPEEETELALKIQAGGPDGEKAKQRLSEANLRLVVSIAKRYVGRGMLFLDLIQEGNIGLMKAVRHYDPDKGVRLMTFAVHWIRAEIQEYIVRNSHMVKLATTHAQRKLFFNLRQMKKTDQALTNAQAEDIAEKLNVKPKEVLEMEKRLSGPDASLDTPLDEEGDSSVTAVDMLSDKSDEPVEILEKADELQLEQVGLKKAIEQLDPRSRRIIEARWFHENDEGEVKAVSLATLAKEFGISIERVRQLEKQAIAKLKKILTESSGK